ncbi:MAG: hypothetical protein QXO02_08890 [Thermofilaceae archaeon]
MRTEVIAIIVITVAAATLTAPLTSAQIGIPILIDLAHKQPTAGVDVIMNVVPEASWYVLVRTKEDADALPAAIKARATVVIGDFATVDLERLRIAMVIIGQPQAPLTPEEIAALAKWFTAAPGRALWVAADSDYPAQGSELAQEVANMIMEAIGSNLRVDYTSVYCYVSLNLTGASYRVLGYVNVSEVPELRYGSDLVLFHGPGPLAWVDDAGNWRRLSPTEKPRNTYIIAMTSPYSEITENQVEPTGKNAKVYKPGDKGQFVLMAAQLIPVKDKYNVAILSGETPYGGYYPGVAWQYYGVVLSGPRFVRNVILWATGYMGELKEYAKLAALPEQIRSDVDRTLTQLRSDIERRISSVEATVAGFSSTLNAALALAAVALILAIVALALAFRKPAPKPSSETVAKQA